MRLIATGATALLLALTAGTGTALAGYSYQGNDTLTVQSTNGKAAAKGHINWYHGGFPKGYIHRGDYFHDAKVYAVKPVGCIWAKVTFGYPAGSLSVGPGGPAGSVEGGQYDNGYFVNCRAPGHRRPTRLSLNGIGYAKALLNSSTLEVCVSPSKDAGPRFCAFQKYVY
jgi:hypothetical protein